MRKDRQHRRIERKGCEQAGKPRAKQWRGVGESDHKYCRDQHPRRDIPPGKRRSRLSIKSDLRHQDHGHDEGAHSQQEGPCAVEAKEVEKPCRPEKCDGRSGQAGRPGESHSGPRIRQRKRRLGHGAGKDAYRRVGCEMDAWVQGEEEGYRP